MPKLYCTCGYVHNLTTIPDDGFITVKDKDYERLIEAEQTRNELSSAKQDTPQWDKLLSCDQLVSDVTERIYECPQCGRLMWERNDNNIYIYGIEDRRSVRYDDYELSEKEILEVNDNEQLFKVIDRLVNIWCNRKCLKALRYILEGWPLAGGLSDDWAQLRTSLRHIVGLGKGELDNREIKLVQECINYIDKIVFRTR